MNGRVRVASRRHFLATPAGGSRNGGTGGAERGIAIARQLARAMDATLTCIRVKAAV
ncbi:hypothetical protein BURKHO8Y_60204 [Burkholderia sp. 8Y]|uniref:hypothetical protein n=1 Tax=Burkholderia sp. 8Y TaxID=2653133 RepID=UPI0012EF9651|nr:hypothetical protein BURKHO8Y_60204 [Burkholderia sp. 8Y]